MNQSIWDINHRNEMNQTIWYKPEQSNESRAQIITMIENWIINWNNNHRNEMNQIVKYQPMGIIEPLIRNNNQHYKLNKI